MQKLVSSIVYTAVLSSLSYAGSVATMEKTKTGVYWTPNSGVNSVTLSVSGPNDFHLQKLCNTTDISINEFPYDGLYKYEITSNPPKLRRARTERDDTLSTQSNKSRGLKESGHFRVVDGQPLITTKTKEK